jgi:hypothetical protein
MSHREHDLFLVASLAGAPDALDAPAAPAGRPSDDPDHARAEALVAGCADCARLHADLVALAVATRALPAPALPRRDFRLTETDAARLRPSGWRRLVGVFAGPRDAITRPLAMGLTTIGLAGLLVGTIPAVAPVSEALFRGAAGAPASVDERDVVATAAPAPGEGYAPEPARPDVQGGSNDNGQPPGDGTDGLGTVDKQLAPDPTGLSTLIVVSGSLLIMGLGLFALRWTARRFGD